MGDQLVGDRGRLADPGHRAQQPQPEGEERDREAGQATRDHDEREHERHPGRGHELAAADQDELVVRAATHDAENQAERTHARDAAGEPAVDVVCHHSS